MAGSIIWFQPKAAEFYHLVVPKRASGVVDEKFVEKYIKNQKEVKVVSLGIGTGRELSWLDKLKNVKEIIGVDYSPAMLKICKDVAKKCKIKITLVRDNLLRLKKFKRIIKNEKLPLIYICLINTLGNFKEKDREKVLRNVRNLMKAKDRLILCLYKRPERIKITLKILPALKIKTALRGQIALALEYYYNEVLWSGIYKKFYQIPQFIYDRKTNDVAVFCKKRKIFISHRFSKEEIEELAKIAKLKIEKLIEGKFMYVVILKI